MTDLKAVSGNTDVGLGPIAQAITNRSYDEAVLLNNWDEASAQDYGKWLRQQTSSQIIIRQVRLSGPTQSAWKRRPWKNRFGAFVRNFSENSRQTHFPGC